MDEEGNKLELVLPQVISTEDSSSAIGPQLKSKDAAARNDSAYNAARDDKSKWRQRIEKSTDSEQELANRIASYQKKRRSEKLQSRGKGSDDVVDRSSHSRHSDRPRRSRPHPSAY